MFKIMNAHLVAANEIEKGCTQVQIAQTYALAMRDSREETDWTALNGVILAKWGNRGLSRIKNMAWKALETGVFPGATA